MGRGGKAGQTVSFAALACGTVAKKEVMCLRVQVIVYGLANQLEQSFFPTFQV